MLNVQLNCCTQANSCRCSTEQLNHCRAFVALIRVRGRVQASQQHVNLYLLSAMCFQASCGCWRPRHDMHLSYQSRSRLLLHQYVYASSGEFIYRTINETSLLQFLSARTLTCSPPAFTFCLHCGSHQENMSAAKQKKHCALKPLQQLHAFYTGGSVRLLDEQRLVAACGEEAKVCAARSFASICAQLLH